MTLTKPYYQDEWPPAGVKWYYSDEWVAIACADCRKILPQLPDKSIDLVLTDPPYGVGLDYLICELCFGATQ